MSKTVSHVDAIFGGKSVRFELSRSPDVIGPLEKDLGSINAAWGRFITGDWTIVDVATILAAAHPHIPVPAKEPELSHQLAMMGGKTLTSKATRPLSPREMGVMMMRRPLATYVPLAAAVLTAAFLGRPEGSPAIDEDAPLIEERKPAA